MKTKINLLEFFLQQEQFSRVMIFTRTKSVADNVFNFVDRKGYGPVRVIHSNKGQNSRINAVAEFKDGGLRVLVSTDVTARGIDVTQVTHVINFDVPVLYEDYVHRIGRTGRAFQHGEAITLATPADRYHIGRIEALIRESIPLKDIPGQVEITDTPFAETQAMAMEIDKQRKRSDPDFKGAFHERKGKKQTGRRR